MCARNGDIFNYFIHCTQLEVDETDRNYFFGFVYFQMENGHRFYHFHLHNGRQQQQHVSVRIINLWHAYLLFVWPLSWCTQPRAGHILFASFLSLPCFTWIAVQFMYIFECIWPRSICSHNGARQADKIMEICTCRRTYHRPAYLSFSPWTWFSRQTTDQVQQTSHEERSCASRKTQLQLQLLSLSLSLSLCVHVASSFFMPSNRKLKQITH